MGSIVTCPGSGELWLINNVDTDNPDSNLTGYCPGCENTAKDLELKVRIIKDKKTSQPKAQPANVPAHEIEVPGYRLDYVLVNGDFNVHDPACKTLPRDLKRSDYTEPGVLYADDTTDAIRQLWDDQLADSWTPDDDPQRESDTPDTGPSLVWLSKNRYTSATHFHSCVKNVFPKPGKGKGTGEGKTSDTGYTPRQAKRDLATELVKAIGAAITNLPDDSEILTSLDRETARRIAAQWIHHLPADRAEWVKHLPAPDRSDWAPKATETAEPDDTDTDTDTDTEDTDSE